MRLFTFILATLSSLFIFGQNQIVQEWQEHHPDVIFIEQDVFSNFSNEKVEQLGDKIIVYHATISINDISSYESTSKSNFLENTDAYIKPDFKQPLIIKRWLALNKDVKIIKRSFYDALSQERCNIYNSANAMILMGETITVADIEAYNP